MRSASPAPKLEIDEERIATCRKIIKTQTLLAESHIRISAIISDALEELVFAYESQKPKAAPENCCHAGEEGLLMSEDEPLRNRIALYGILIAVYLISVFLSFDAGTIYQKEHGPPGSECKTGTYRQPEDKDGAAECVDGFWEKMLPPSFPPKPEEKKK